MEKLKEDQEEILTFQEEEKENFKNDFENFNSYWEKEAEELKNREINEENSKIILYNFLQARMEIYVFRNLYKFSLSDSRKLKLTESKLHNSLAIARSNFRSKHKTILERFVDSIGGLFHFFGKGN
jgi:hypothetical protein